MKLTRMTVAASVLTLLVTACVQLTVADEELGKRASWSPASAAEIRGQIQKWLEDRKVDEVTKLKIDTLWPEDGVATDNGDVLEQLAATFALVDRSAQPLVDHCRGQRLSPRAPKFECLEDKKADKFVRNNLRLFYGRWLAQHDLYDEALEQFDGLNPKDVVDPAALLFYRSVAQHKLLKKDECLAGLTVLMENETAIPRRYATMAQLMEADIKPLKTDSLDEISRLMADANRRQGLFRSGTRVRTEEDQILEKLQKMIDELEEQQKQQQGGGGTGSGGSQSSSPAGDSAPLGGKGPGHIDPKRLPDGKEWGDLPPKERAAAMAELAKDLPAHYREVIEEYFRKIAKDEPR